MSIDHLMGHAYDNENAIWICKRSVYNHAKGRRKFFLNCLANY